jgi:hypothetical protein
MVQFKHVISIIQSIQKIIVKLKITSHIYNLVNSKNYCPQASVYASSVYVYYLHIYNLVYSTLGLRMALDSS